MKKFKIILLIIISSFSLGVLAQENSISPIISLSESNNGFSNTLNSLNQITGKAISIESFATESFVGNNFAISTLESSNVDKLYLLNSNNNLSVYDIPYFFDPNYSGFQNELIVTNNITDIDYHHSSSTFFAYDLISKKLYNLSLSNASILSTVNIPFHSIEEKFSIKTTNDYIVLSGNNNDTVKIIFYEIASNTHSEKTLNTLYKEFNIVSNNNLDSIYAIAKDLNDINYLIKINPSTQDVNIVSSLPSCTNCVLENISYDKNGLAIDWENNELLAILNKTTNNGSQYYFLTFDLLSGDVKYFSNLEKRTSNLYFSKASVDLVFPGDCNHDGIVNAKDLFSIGLKYSFNTTPRFTQNIDWIGQHSFNTGIIRQGVDVKHADCNGDGQINDIDIEAILENYSYIHNSSKSASAINEDCDYPLSFALNTIVNENSEAKVNIKLGETSAIVNDVYGVSFTVSYDTSFVVPNTMHTESLDSWFGTVNTNYTQIDIDDYNNGIIDVSLTGIDLLNRSGGGDILTLAWTIEGDLIPIANPFVTMDLKIDNITIINYEEDILDACGVDTNIIVYKEGVAIKNIDKTLINIYPNPTHSLINIDSEVDIDFIEVLSLEGKILKVLRDKAIDVSKFSTGIYYIKLYTIKGIYIDKIIVRN